VWTFGKTCSKCQGGFMPEFTKDRCVPTLDKCLNAPVGNQPDKLVVDTTSKKFICDTCQPGTFWNAAKWICDSCDVSGCAECSSVGACDKCVDGKLLQPNKGSCIDYLSNCIIPKHL